MPKPVCLSPEQELKTHQAATMRWGRQKGYFKPEPKTAKERVFGVKPIVFAKKTTQAPTIVPKASARPNPLLRTVAKKVAEPQPLPVEFSDKLTKLETARVFKNFYARQFEKLEKEVKEEFEAMGRDSLHLALTAKDVKGADVSVILHLDKVNTGGQIEVETLHPEFLRDLTTPEIFDKCITIVKAKVIEHVGKGILDRITTTETVTVQGGPVVTIKSEKVKD